MTTSTTYLDDLRAEAKALADQEFLVGTNEGTYSAVQAHAKMGCGDPQFANTHIYERVGDGARRVVGCELERSPGYIREFRLDIKDARRRLTELRRSISEANRHARS